MKGLFTLVLGIAYSRGNNIKEEFCSNLLCGNPGTAVCGIREEGSGFRLRLFDDECRLLEHGCSVPDNEAYGIINIEYCQQTFSNETLITDNRKIVQNESEECVEIDCTYPGDGTNVCAITQAGNGFKVRLFQNKCLLAHYNCINKANYTITDLQICDGVVTENLEPKRQSLRTQRMAGKILPKVFIVDASMLNYNNNVNDTINSFFAMTHVLDLPVTEINVSNETTRRMIVKVFGPQVVYKPWIRIPKNISDDYYHRPTLNSCFHKCPMKCPETYAPVCGMPGISSREPSLMFQNHCFMDAAQCKMRWEESSDTTVISAYIESSFMFCLGDTLNTLFRFLPLVRTLQHMGRLKKKGFFRYKMRNMGFLNNELIRDPNLMGK